MLLQASDPKKVWIVPLRASNPKVRLDVGIALYRSKRSIRDYEKDVMGIFFDRFENLI